MIFTPPSDAWIKDAFPTITQLEEFARGGFKVVFKAEIHGHCEMFKLVCLPEADPTDEEKQAYRKEALGRIRREVALLGKCVRPELVKLGSLPPTVVTIQDVEYVGYSEEFLHGDNLWKRLRAGGEKPAEAEARRLLLSLLRAIEELWGEHRTIHRDIKPENVVKIENDERPFVLLDLGIAYGLLETGLTRDGGAPCTPRYLAPEMARPDYRRNLDFRTDLYTSALTVFEYSAQIHPLAETRDDLVRTISRAIHQPPRRLRAERQDFSEAFCDLIDQMLKKKPQLRPSDLKGLIAYLEKPL